MRLILIITFLGLTHLTISQTLSPRDKVSLTIKEADLRSSIHEIEKKTAYRFIYGEEIKFQKPVTLSVTDMPLEEVLTILFKGQEIAFRFENAHILLTKKAQAAPTKSKRTISGFIYNEHSHETIIGANVYDPESGDGTVTNEYGFYSLTLPSGNRKVRFSYIGYESEEKEFDLSENKQFNLTLKQNKQLAEVIVYSNKSETGFKATQMSALDIPVEVIKNTPVLLGETDVLKTIQLMPGVQAGTEGSAGVYVRGGGPDENIILLDGVPLYNVDHVAGFFSVFTPEAIKKVSFFKGSFPARFGGRLSSVIDIRTNDGDMRKYHGTIGIGLLSSKLQFEGPIIKDRTSFNISARRSYLDILSKPFIPKDEKFGFYFYDLNAKINHRFNDRSRLFISLYNGDDKLTSQFKEREENFYSMDKVSMGWGNLLLAAKWNYQLSSKIFANTTLAYTKYKFKVNSRAEEELKKSKEHTSYSSNYNSGIYDITANIDFDYHPLPTHYIKFGGGYLHHRFRPEVQTSRMKSNEEGFETDTLYKSNSNSLVLAHEANIYAEDDFSIGDKLNANLGFHLSLFHVDNKTYTSFQPRISLRYQLNDNLVLKASYTKMSQYIHRLSSYTINMPSDLWVPATKDIKPMQAHQYSIGAYYSGINGWEFSAEAYYKDMRNVLEYKDGASFIGSSENWEEKVEMGKGRAMGIELMAQKTIGRSTGWISYTLAKSDRKFSKEGINNGKRFPYRYDRRHHITAVFNHKFSDRIDISASWEFYTGGTTTLAEEKATIIRPEGYDPLHYISNLTQMIPPPYSVTEVDYIKNRNNYRMPASHCLNVGVNFRKKTKRGERIWNVGVYNVYNAMNPTFLYKRSGENTYYGPEGKVTSINPKSKLKKVTILPFIPSFTYTYKF